MEQKPVPRPQKTKKKKSRINGFEEWGGYMESKKTKLMAQFKNKMQFESDDVVTSDIFQGISIYVNGYTKPSAEELKRMIMLHGGTYHYYYSVSRTSHMVTMNLPDSKIVNLKGQKVVSPDWIVDSIKAGKLLPDFNYMLYTPEVTDRQQRLQLVKTNQSHYTSSRNNAASESAISYSTLDIPHCSTSSVKCKDSVVEQHDLTEVKSSTSESPPSVNKIAAMKAGHPDFISEFYNRSRLHHIATAGQELKLYVQQLASEQKGKPFLGREKLRQQRIHHLKNAVASTDSNTIMHLDMDCFFVSVGLRNHPELRGQPVAVTHSKGKQGAPTEGSNVEYEANYYRNKVHKNSAKFDDDGDFEIPSKISKHSNDYGSLSEIASCSYEARQAGIKNGMFLGMAMQLCPNLKTIPYDFEGYSETSKLLYDTVASYSLDIEAVSCDELYIDCMEILQDVQISAAEFAHILRSEVYEKTKCTASAGIGKNMLIARLATKLAKPNGQCILLDDQIEEFMKKELVKELPGVGYSTSAKLKQLGINTCGELQNWSLKKLQQEFGPKTGQTLFEHCRGIDHRSVTLEKDRKSVSAEINYGIRFEKEQEIYNFINELAIELEQRLKKIDRKGRSLSLKLRVRKEDAPMETAKFLGHGVCDSICKSTGLKVATDDAKIIGAECCAIARALKIRPQDYRGLGIQITKLEASTKDPTIKTIDHFLAKTYEVNKTDNRNLDSEPLQIPAASSDIDDNQQNVHSKENGSKLNHNNQANQEITRGNVPSLYSQSAYYAQVLEIDQSVLDALPEELQQELLMAQAKRQRGGSPRKILSPSKVNKPSNANKRGRPAGGKNKKGKMGNHTSPQKTMKDYQKAAASKDINSSCKASSTITSLSETVSSNIVTQNSNIVTQNSNIVTQNSNIVTQNSNIVTQNSNIVKKAHLAGATDLNKVRGLIKEWMTTTDVPIEEDIGHLKNYLIPLVEEDLEKTDLVLKHFHRLASSAEQCWKDSYLLILSYVQQKMLQDFGYMLKARDSFS